MKKLSNYLPALSLPELLIGVVIIAIISTMVGAIFLAHSKIFSDQQAQVYVSSQNRAGLDEIANQIREAQAVVATPDSCLDCGSDTTSSTQVLILKLLTFDGSGNPQNNGKFDYVVYKCNSCSPPSGGTLTKSVFVDASSSRKSLSAKIISKGTTSLSFTYSPTMSSSATQVQVQLDNIVNSLRGARNVSQTAKANLKNSPNAANNPGGPPNSVATVSFPYVLQAGTGDLTFEKGMGSSSDEVLGNVYSNSNISTIGCSSNCKVEGNASAVGSIATNLVITGTKCSTNYPPACLSQPLPDINLGNWQNYAAAGGAQSCTSPYTITGPLTLTKKQYNCDVNLTGTITITGTIYVAGTLTIKANSIITLDNSFSSCGTVVQASAIIIEASTTVKQTDSFPPGYIVFASPTNNISTETIKITTNSSPPNNINAILYSPSGYIHVLPPGGSPGSFRGAWAAQKITNGIDSDINHGSFIYQTLINYPLCTQGS